MKKLILFDIDGTLINKSEEEINYFSHGIKEVYNINTSTKDINFHGKSDQQIIIEILNKKGLNEKEILSKLKKCIISIQNYVKQNDLNVNLNYGIKKLIHKLEKKHILGLVTGNLEQIAIKKLKQVEIYNYFKLGGFGSDAIKRSDIVKIAIKRAKKKFTFNEVFVIGDTPNDIIAGKEANVKTIAVATGIYSINELKKHNPDYVFQNLNNDEIIKIFS